MPARKRSMGRTSEQVQQLLSRYLKLLCQETSGSNIDSTEVVGELAQVHREACHVCG